MLSLPHGFRSLDDALVSYEGDDVFGDVLVPAIPAAVEVLKPLEAMRSLRDAPRQRCSDADLYELFALSVVNDRLLLPHRLSAREYETFFGTLGFSFASLDDFDPLTCEIVKVGNWPHPSEGIRLGRRYWPALMWGELVFSRAAVDVLCHPSHRIVAEVAERSTLYFTQDRFNRTTNCLSHGWGHNSRWRTRFHRNYLTASHSVFNADGTIDLSLSRDEQERLTLPRNSSRNLPTEARRELLVHRCFVSHVERDEFWPYDDVLVVRGRATWPLQEQALASAEEVDGASP
jgi:hypothetical protein